MINWSPTVSEEIMQNVRFLLATAPGSVPLFRAFGVPQDILDAPQSVAGARLQAAVVVGIREYEPRIKLRAVRLVPDADGKLTVTLELVP